MGVSDLKREEHEGIMASEAKFSRDYDFKKNVRLE